MTVGLYGAYGLLNFSGALAAIGGAGALLIAGFYFVPGLVLRERPDLAAAYQVGPDSPLPPWRPRGWKGAALAGLIYGRHTGTFGPQGTTAIAAMEATMVTMASYMVLMFFAAQFVAWFGWTNLGIIAAIQGSEVLRALGLGSVPLLMAFVLLAASINLFVGSATAKWAIMAPVFIPMLMLVGISPEATQMAYRIGDSTTNIITPLMPYLGLVVAFAQRWDPKAGIGSIIATMLPYSVALFLTWTTLLAIWLLAGLPLGPGAGLYWAPPG